jgi:hypothetical protein
MPYTAQQLITRSWYLSGIVARNLQTVSGDQINNGLMLLNALLDFKQIETDLIPYWTYIQLTLVPNQEFYFLPNVVAIESATFNLDVVRYSMMPSTRRDYYGSSRVDNISSLPFGYNYNRALGGGNLALYFKPQSNYPAKLMVKIALTDVSLDTDLTNITSGEDAYTYINSSNVGYDRAYIEYLRLALARYMCSEYGIIFNPESEKILVAMERKLMFESPPDLSRTGQTMLGSSESAGWNWGDVNLGRGWRPS